MNKLEELIKLYKWRDVQIVKLSKLHKEVMSEGLSGVLQLSVIRFAWVQVWGTGAGGLCTFRAARPG